MDTIECQADTCWSWREGKDTTYSSAQFKGSLRTHDDMNTSTLCNAWVRRRAKSRTTYLRFHKLISILVVVLWLVMCWAGLGPKAQGWAWACENCWPSPDVRPGLRPWATGMMCQCAMPSLWVFSKHHNLAQTLEVSWIASCTSYL